MWEIQIKAQLGKLQLELPLTDMLEQQVRINGLEILPVHLEHVLGLESLPLHHKDPFDRLLVSQANVENIPLVSGDALVSLYPVRVLW